MMRKMPQVREFMTKVPLTIPAGTTIETIRNLMREHGVRHLPVIDGDHLVGIVSDRSVKSAGRSALSAQDLLIPNPYAVAPQTPLDEVAATMASERFGCAIVQDERGEVIGIFTTVDACRALRQVLETAYPE